jgi:elongation factor 3
LCYAEPTNYLDRESLGALALAINEWAGGVVVISHHAEFTSSICNENWTVADGKLTIVKSTPDAPEED